MKETEIETGAEIETIDLGIEMKSHGIEIGHAKNRRDRKIRIMCGQHPLTRMKIVYQTPEQVQLNHSANFTLQRLVWLLEGEFFCLGLLLTSIRAMSLDSILDTESVAVDQNQITLRIKPGVYQKRPDVIMAERDAAR